MITEKNHGYYSNYFIYLLEHIYPGWPIKQLKVFFLGAQLKQA